MLKHNKEVSYDKVDETSLIEMLLMDIIVDGIVSHIYDVNKFTNTIVHCLCF